MRAPTFLVEAPTVSTAMGQGSNNFTLIRLALALAVVISPAFSVTTGVVADEPLAGLTGFTLGEHAVNGFFAISGFLVTMSFDRRGWRDYVISRALRIAPGLVAAALVVALLLGGLLTTLPLTEYLGRPELRRFIGATLSSFKSNIALPGVFADNPFRFPMGTVWTLKYEVLCYAGVLAFGLARLLRSLVFSASAYGVIWLALSPALTRFSVEPRAGLSYGAYLYGWPVQQSLHAFWPGAAAAALLAPALAITLAVAALSWFLVEKPALGLKARALGRRTLKTIEPAAP